MRSSTSYVRFEPYRTASGLTVSRISLKSASMQKRVSICLSVRLLPSRHSFSCAAAKLNDIHAVLQATSQTALNPSFHPACASTCTTISTGVSSSRVDRLLNVYYLVVCFCSRLALVMRSTCVIRLLFVLGLAGPHCRTQTHPRATLLWAAG